MSISETSVKHLIAERIRNFRLEQSLSQIEVGEFLGVTFQQVQKYESGANAISIEKLLALCVRTNTPISYFLESSIKLLQGRSETPESPPFTLAPGERKLIECLRDIGDSSAQKHLLEFCKSICKAAEVDTKESGIALQTKSLKTPCDAL